MIEIKNITKKYSETSGNFDISLSVGEGQVYGVIGPNGAGKTTLIRQIMGFIKPDSGTISIFEKDAWKDHEEIMNDVGYLAGEVEMLEGMKGISYLKMMAELKPNVSWEYVEKLIKYFEFDPNKKFKKMSKGMKQKICIISAIMNKPKFLILDEPTSGLDPLMQEKFNNLVQSLSKDNGSTIIICSHIFQEIAKLCDRVGFIKEGKLITEQEIKGKNIEQIEKQFLKLYEKEIEFNEN